MAWKYVIRISAPDSATPTGKSEAASLSWVLANPTKVDAVGITGIPGSIIESVHVSQFTGQPAIEGLGFNADQNF